MICDGVNDLFNVLIKTFYEKDETKKVKYLIGLLESVELMFLCILMELGCLPVGNNLVGLRGFRQYPPLKKLRYCNTLIWPQNGMQISHF